MKKLVKVTFTLSVLLNVFLLGAITSYGYASLHNAPKEHKAVKENLSDEGKRYIKQVHKTTRKEMKETFSKARNIKKELIDVLRKEDFNKEDYEFLAIEMIELQNELLKSKLKMHLQMANDLPSADRKLLSNRLSNFSTEKKKHRARLFKEMQTREHHLFPKDQTSP
jgi:uncharacterized membrane protein